MKISKPDLHHENKYRGIVAGVDEAGRGPLSGPVIAAAVIINKQAIIDGTNDSKQTTSIKRLNLYKQIIHTYKYAIGIASVKEIDHYNIGYATKLAMRKAINNLNTKIKLDIILIDGNIDPNDGQNPIHPIINGKCYTIIHGDCLSISIAAASIIAKVTRDKIMQDLHKCHPIYNWYQNKGYGTKEHILAIKNHGISPHHRKTFAPMKHKLFFVQQTEKLLD